MGLGRTTMSVWSLATRAGTGTVRFALQIPFGRGRSDHPQRSSPKSGRRVGRKVFDTVRSDRLFACHGMP